MCWKEQGLVEVNIRAVKQWTNTYIPKSDSNLPAAIEVSGLTKVVDQLINQQFQKSPDK